jgi:glycosyltransferase involved in cell wall biosynthesis
MGEVKVSVCIFVYNLENYIAQAIESVLMQKTKFRYEIIIGEDMSTDQTRGICISYQKSNPDKIRLLLREKNLGMTKNIFDTLKEASGEYVAILDGDDYWIDPLKLQKQVDFMDLNPDFSLCCHNSFVLYEDHNIAPYLFNPRNQNDIIPIEELILKWSMATASMLYRRSCMSFPDWVYKAHNFDLAIQILVADKGKVKFLKDIMSIYRKTLLSNSFNPKYKDEYPFIKQIELFNIIDEEFHNKYTDTIKKKKSLLERGIRQIKFNKRFPLVKYFYPRKIYKNLGRLFI